MERLGSRLTLFMVVACLLGMVLLSAGAAAGGMLGGSADVAAPVVVLLVVALGAALVGPAVSQPVGGIEKGLCAVIAILLLTVGAALGVGWFTGAIGTASAYAVTRTRDRQLTARLICVAVAALATNPLCGAFGGMAWVTLPVGLAVLAIVAGDALARERGDTSPLSGA